MHAEQAAAVIEKLQARAGQTHPAWQAHEELGAELFFDAAHVPRQRGFNASPFSLREIVI